MNQNLQAAGKGFVLLLLMCTGIKSATAQSQWLLPLEVENRASLRNVRLTNIGAFALPRKTRPTVSTHLHAGIDFARWARDKDTVRVFAASAGKVISVRTDGAFAQIIIEHHDRGKKLWTVYEHVAGIRVRPGEMVSSQTVIARLMSREELVHYGWQFNHLHFEILIAPPKPLVPTLRTPHRYFMTYALECETEAELLQRYINPPEFFKSRWQHYNLSKSSGSASEALSKTRK
ncbi:MAG: M23 family metallopeptidase [Rhizobacter sp.]|nr:M23 family metallopeptidase [Chlorobiales bacterium]